MYQIYVDVPYNYKYEYHGESCGPEVLSRDFGVPFVFICNGAQGRFNKTGLGVVGNKGDAHAVLLKSKDDELFFLLKSGFTRLNNSVVENYVKKKRTEELGKRKFNETCN